MSAAIDEGAGTIIDGGGDGGGAPEPVAPVTPVAEPSDWRASLPEDIRENQTLATIKSVEDLAKQHVNVQKLIGAEKIPRPKEDWGEEEYAEFYSKLGRPNEVDDYDLGEIAPPEGLPWDDEFQSSMLSVMHEAGLNSQQVQKILGGYIESVGGQFQESMGDAQRTRDEGIRDLQNEWGKSYGANVDLAQRAFKAGAGEGFEEVAGLPLQDGSALGDHPLVIKAFAALGRKMNEDGLVGEKTSMSTFSPAQAGAERNKLMSDKDFLAAYLDEGHLEHAAAVKKMHDLTIAEVGIE